MFVDTNVLLRFLLADNTVQSPAARSFFREVRDGRREAWTTPVALFELVYVLSSPSGGGLDRKDVVEKLNEVLAIEGLEIEQRTVLQETAGIYGVTNIDFADAYHAALVLSRCETQICSFDQDFDGIDGIERVEP